MGQPENYIKIKIKGESFGGSLFYAYICGMNNTKIEEIC